MKFELTTTQGSPQTNRQDGNQTTVAQTTVEVPGKAVVGAVAGGTAIVTVIVALISAGTTWITTKYVEIPKNRESIDIQKKANELAKNKFQLESLQKALQAKSPEDRARSLGLLVDMKLIDIPSAKVDEFIKKPEIVPQWVVEPSVAASDAAKNSTPKAEQKTLPKSR